MMEASAAPETQPGNPRTRFYAIGAIVLVVLLIIGYSYMKNRRNEALLASMASKDRAERVAAARALIENERYVDLILTQVPDVRETAIKAAEEYAAEGTEEALNAVSALLGISKGVDREINDPEVAVRDREIAVRKTTWMTIGRIGDVGKDLLIEALKDPSGNVRAAAIESLGIIGSPAIPDLMAMMTERDTWGPAGDALVKIGRPALDHVLPLIDTPGEKKKARDLRLKMAGMLGAFDDQKVVPSLLRHIDATDPGMRRQVIRTLASLQDQRATLDVIRVMREDPQVRLDAITALGEFRDPRAIDPLVDQFDSYDYDVSSNAVSALAEIGPPSLPRLLTEAKNPNAQIRTYATRGLATIGGPQTINPLITAARDPVASVRREAVEGMSKFEEDDAVRAVPLLIAGFRDDSAEVSNAAVESLRVIGANQSNASIMGQIVRPLMALFERGGEAEDVYNNQVYYAERVLSQIGAPAIPYLTEALRTGTPAVKKWSALTLGDMREDRDAVVRQSVNTLRQLARSSDPEAAWAARDALSRIGIAVEA